MNTKEQKLKELIGRKEDNSLCELALTDVLKGLGGIDILWELDSCNTFSISNTGKEFSSYISFNTPYFKDQPQEFKEAILSLFNIK